MAPRPLVLTLLLLSAGLAACTEAPGADEGAEAAPPARLSLTGCSGFMAHVGPLPTAVAPGSAPAGWEPDAADQEAYVRMAGFECERLGLAHFERPVRLVVDSHTRASIPDACHRSALREITGLVGTVWVDDEEVASYLAKAYGLPARFAAIEAEAQANGPAEAHAWSWGDAEGVSQATVLHAGLGEEANVPLLLLWPRGDGHGVASLAFAFEGRDAPNAELPALGNAAGPALLAALPGGTFAGMGIWDSSFAAEGTFTLYRDMMCAEPEVAT